MERGGLKNSVSEKDLRTQLTDNSIWVPMLRCGGLRLTQSGLHREGIMRCFYLCMAQALKTYFYFGPEVVLHIPDLHFTFLN